jgi:hypothetical protein
MPEGSGRPPVPSRAASLVAGTRSCSRFALCGLRLWTPPLTPPEASARHDIGETLRPERLARSVARLAYAGEPFRADGLYPRGWLTAPGRSPVRGACRPARPEALAIEARRVETSPKGDGSMHSTKARSCKETQSLQSENLVLEIYRLL